MGEQKRSRDEAFHVSWEALNLAQDLSFDAEFCNPKYLKRRYRWFANKVLLDEMIKRQERIEGYVKQAYELNNMIQDWADEYPLVESENKF